MGFRVVLGCYVHMMLSMGNAQALFSQNEPLGYPKLYLIKHIYIAGYPGIYLSDHTVPGLLPYSSALPLRPGGSLQYVY